jgi:peptidoglycan hydrolase-like protein with peptidoglycan-binding domain
MSTHVTKLSDAIPGEWYPAPWGAGEVMMPGRDRATGGYARLTLADQVEASRREGARLFSFAEAQSLIRTGGWIEPVLATDAMGRGLGAALATYRVVDEEIDRRLAAAVKPLLVAKICLHALPGEYVNYGMPREAGDPASVWQPPGRKHGPTHVDYSQLWQCYRPGQSQPIKRPTLRLGDVGEHVKAWQVKIGAKADAVFGPATAKLTRAHQSAHGLVPDAVVGERTWATVGEEWKPAAITTSAEAPACRRALRDASAAYPGRNRASDGIMGDASHQARASDHNLGNAVDITHDPAHGCEGGVLASLAMSDRRVKLIIWDRRIWNPAVSPSWRLYTGSNPHTSHVHISIHAHMRGDDSPWPWAP